MTPTSTIFTDIQGQYQVATMGWYAVLLPFAQHLFGLLACCDLAYGGLVWTLDKNSFESIWVEFTKKLITFGFFYAILLNAHVWLPVIIQSFMQAGAAAGQVNTLDPGSIFNQGIALGSAILQASANMGFLGKYVLGGAIFSIFVSLLVFLAFAGIACLLLLTTIESYIVISAGVLLLGFSGSQFTREVAVKQLNYAVSVGVKLFVLYLIIGVGKNLSANWTTLLVVGGTSSPSAFFEVLGGAIVFFMLALAIPNKAASLVSGASYSALGGLMSAAAVAGTVATLPLKTGYGAAAAGLAALRQAVAVGQTANTTVGGIAKGAAMTGKNLVGAALGTLAGHYPTVASGLQSQTNAFQQKQAAKAETQAASTTATPPPNSGTSAGATHANASATGQTAGSAGQTRGGATSTSTAAGASASTAPHSSSTTAAVGSSATTTGSRATAPSTPSSAASSAASRASTGSASIANRPTRTAPPVTATNPVTSSRPAAASVVTRTGAPTPTTTSTVRPQFPTNP